mmetsp:Transcript_115771/g.230805  ORF Transcript_115771/g.230805 Transcript_115771/m.230805 type:complete len:241 (-) Transcript_115771:399-1121(-)
MTMPCSPFLMAWAELLSRRWRPLRLSRPTALCSSSSSSSSLNMSQQRSAVRQGSICRSWTRLRQNSQRQGSMGCLRTRERRARRMKLQRWWSWCRKMTKSSWSGCIWTMRAKKICWYWKPWRVLPKMRRKEFGYSHQLRHGSLRQLLQHRSLKLLAGLWKLDHGPLKRLSLTARSCGTSCRQHASSSTNSSCARRLRGYVVMSRTESCCSGSKVNKKVCGDSWLRPGHLLKEPTRNNKGS